jgi:hypothetical protein
VSTHKIKVGRPYSRLRIGAYECELDRGGNLIKKSGQIAGWYGMFTPDRLQKEIMPKLAEYAAQGRHYPFLIATYQLENKAVVSPRNDVLAREVKASDIKFSRRRRKSTFVLTAVVNSASEYRLINS